MEKILPELVQKYEKYKNYKLRQLCQEIHNFYKSKNISFLQRNMSLEENFPEYVMNPQDANFEYIRGKGELIPLSECKGRISLESVLSHPPGITSILPGEKWNENTQKYFLCIEDIINQYPGFEIELQGIYEQKEDGKIKFYVIVLKKEFEPKK